MRLGASYQQSVYTITAIRSIEKRCEHDTLLKEAIDNIYTRKHTLYIWDEMEMEQLVLHN